LAIPHESTQLFRHYTSSPAIGSGDRGSRLGSSGTARDAYGAQGKYAQAEALLSQALEIERRVLGPKYPATLNTLSGFASMYQRQGKYALA